MEKSWIRESHRVWETLGTNRVDMMFDNKTFRGKFQELELNWVLSHFPDGAQYILDAGCGSGRYTIPLKEKGYEVVSYDFSRNMLKYLYEKSKKNLVLVEGDIQKLPFKDNSFDAVILLDVLHHLQTNEMRYIAISEAFRVSKRTIFFDIKNKYNPYIWYRYNMAKATFIRTAYSYKEISDVIKKSNGKIIDNIGIGFPIKLIAPYIIIKAIKR
jgi:ubiquinone/menaquinone biosynthesis C-methylase UbiE